MLAHGSSLSLRTMSVPAVAVYATGTPPMTIECCVTDCSGLGGSFFAASAGGLVGRLVRGLVLRRRRRRQRQPDHQEHREFLLQSRLLLLHSRSHFFSKPAVQLVTIATRARAALRAAAAAIRIRSPSCVRAQGRERRHLHEDLRRPDLESGRARLDLHRHRLVVEVAVDDFLAALEEAAPESSGGRDLPLAAGPRKGNDVELVSARLVET